MDERPAVFLVGRRVHHDERRLCFATSNPEITPKLASSEAGAMLNRASRVAVSHRRNCCSRSKNPPETKHCLRRRFVRF